MKSALVGRIMLLQMEPSWPAEARLWVAGSALEAGHPLILLQVHLVTGHLEYALT